MRAGAAVALSIALASVAPPADAEPNGRMSALVGIRGGAGRFGDDYGLGFLYGVEASWEPIRPGHRIGYAIHWSFVRGNFGSDPAAITGSLDLIEMSLGARLRIASRQPGLSMFLGGGGSLLRASSPLPPDDARDYAAGYAGAGAELLAWDSAIVTFELRYGLIGAGPSTVSAVLGVGFGI